MTEPVKEQIVLKTKIDGVEQSSTNRWWFTVEAMTDAFWLYGSAIFAEGDRVKITIEKVADEP